MKKKRLLAIIACVCIILLIAGIIYILPRPILSHSENAKILSVQIHADDQPALTEIVGYNEKEILACLSRYKAYPSFSRSLGYNMADVSIKITIEYNGEIKILLLGDINYLDGTYGKPRFLIRNAAGLKEELSSHLA